MGLYPSAPARVHSNIDIDIDIDIYPQDLREEMSSVTLKHSMETVDPLKSENVAARLCVRISSLYAHTCSGRES